MTAAAPRRSAAGRRRGLAGGAQAGRRTRRRRSRRSPAPGPEGAVTLEDVERARRRRSRRQRPRRSDAADDRRRDGAQQARDPALLPRRRRAARARRWPGSPRATPARPRDRAAAARAAAAEGGRARGAAVPGVQRLLPATGGSWPAPGVHVRRGDLAARRRPDRAGAARRPAQGRRHRSCANCSTSCARARAGTLRASELVRPDDHRHEPRRPGRRAVFRSSIRRRSRSSGFGRVARAAVGRRRRRAAACRW